MDWYKIQFVNALAYPERVKSDLYVSTSVVRTFFNEGNITKIDKTVGPIKKKIVVNVTEEMLYAYDDGVLFMKEPVSTGLIDTPTKVGVYNIYKKTPSRYMQGSADGLADQYYDLPGVPWNLYFTTEGDVIHGAYWHNSFGKKWSHGCVNMEPQRAKKLYEWAVVGTPVIVTN
jgi:lipoprotein-anchoring transpeptidase ErfK/SrfK